MIKILSLRTYIEWGTKHPIEILYKPKEFLRIRSIVTNVPWPNIFLVRNFEPMMNEGHTDAYLWSNHRHPIDMLCKVGEDIVIQVSHTGLIPIGQALEVPFAFNVCLYGE
jgi:hypothetical protein